MIRKQIIQLVRAAVNNAHGDALAPDQVVELPRHAGQVGIAGRRGGGCARVGCRGGGGARLGDGTRPRGRVRMRAGARRGGRGCLSEVRREGLYDHCFGVGLGLGDTCRGFGRRARARGGVGSGGGGRAGWRAGLGRRQRAGAAGHRRARHGWAERGGRRGCCRRRAGVGYLGVAAQVDAALASGLVDLYHQLPVAVIDVAVAVLTVRLARHMVIRVIFQHMAHPAHAARGHVAVGVIAVAVAIG